MTMSSHCTEVEGRRIEYRMRSSSTARKIRVRVSLSGIEVVRPAGRSAEDVEAFLRTNAGWLRAPLDRVKRLGRLRHASPVRRGEILFRGLPTEVHLEEGAHAGRGNRVRLDGGKLLILQGQRAPTTPAMSLESWLRGRARESIEEHLVSITAKLNVAYRTLYVMDQRTKWGNCSSMQNLSFNWRIIMAPEYVLRYLVTHEAVHLAVPDHSRRFWLTVQSLCADADRARGWLSANALHLLVNLDDMLLGSAPGRHLQ